MLTSGEYVFTLAIKMYSSMSFFGQSSEPMTHVLDYNFVSSDVCVTRLQPVTFLCREKQSF